MYLLNQSIETGYNPLLISFLVVICSVLGISTISSKNTIHSVLCLILLFGGISLYLILLNLTFIGISYLLVYVGAVSILFLFIVMLINVRTAELLTEERNSTVLGVLVVISFSFIFIDEFSYSLVTNKHIYQPLNYIYNLNSFTDYNYDIDTLLSNEYHNYVGSVSSNQWDINLIQVSHITGIGNLLYNELIVLLTIIAYILLLAIIGALVITIKTDKPVEPAQVAKDSIVLDNKQASVIPFFRKKNKF